MVMKEYHVTMKSCMPNQSKKTRNYNKSPNACPGETTIEATRPTSSEI